MSETEALALIGGLAGGALATFILFIIVVYVLLVIAQWKIFTKAGEAGWKALIPIYNTYILCRIIGISFWKWVIICPFVLGIVLGIIAGIIDNEDIINTCTYLYAFGLEIYMAIRLGKAFDKSTGFIVGLVLLPYIFQLILAFDDSKYIGNNN